MRDCRGFLHDPLIGVGDVDLQFLQRIALAEHAQHFLEFAGAPTAVLTVVERESPLHRVVLPGQDLGSIPAVCVADVDHRLEDGVPRVGVLQRGVGEHTAVPADVLYVAFGGVL